MTDTAPTITLADAAPAPFEPQHTRASQARLDAVIALAAKLCKWPILDLAIDTKVAEQHGFVGWWDNEVRPPGQGNNTALRYFSVADVQAQTGITQQQVSRWRSMLQDAEQYRERLRLAAYRKAGLEPDSTYRSGSGAYEWYTPERYIDAAREVMGGIDLDPATHDAAQCTVRATRCFTADDDGLQHEWHGRVWLNPPYAQPLMSNFVAKLVDEYSAGRVTQAIMLTHNYTDTGWFHDAQSSAALLCFTRGRISFVGALGPPTQGQCFFYFGPQAERFRDTFGAFGFIR